jgi:CubicO group peptidase (beta-lactamase class C family)
MAKTPAWLDAALAYIPEWLGYQMRLTEQPGVSLAVAHRGKVVLECAFGHADLTTGEALTPRHRFRVASHSKSFTAAGMMKLREQGRLKLDDAAGQYVGGLHPKIAAATLSQLLSHTAGVFRDGVDGAYWAGRAPFSDEAAIRADLRLAPIIDAGTRLKYSNHGFALAGLVIEAITGEPYRAWIEREIVASAGLEETNADTPLPGKWPLARGHSGKALLGRRLVFPGDQSTNALAAATGFVSTAADLARFFSQLSPTAKPSFLEAASRREMSRPQWRDPYGQAPRSYGLGTISSAVDDWDCFGHSGGFQGYITRTCVTPAKDLAVSVLTNAVDGPAEPWMDGALQILKRFETGGATAAKRDGWAGRWWSSWGPTDLVPVGARVLLASPALANPFFKVPEAEIERPDQARIVEAGGFHSYGEPVRLVRGEHGQVTSVWVGSGELIPEAALQSELRGRYGGEPTEG